jgi:SAM-dependent methyltransferase
MTQPAASRFDSAYYRRFYLTPATRAMSREEAVRRGNLIAAAVAHLEIPVKRILDLGCGLGWFRKPLLKGFHNATYTGVEYSEYLCEQYGWTQGSVVDFRGRGQYDLLTCCDVLQYLDDRSATKALSNLARLCRGALYLHVPTTEDFAERMDPQGTDTKVHLRSGDWYRKRLAKHFQHVGFGIYVKDDVPVGRWELER